MRLFPCIAAAAAASTLMLSSVTAMAQTVRIGFIAPLTGGSSDFGISARYGAELAVNEINEVGGFMGRKFELVVRDDKADPATGLAVSQDLVLKEKVHFTVGFCNTGVAMKSLEVFQKNAHVLMVPCSQGTALTKTYPAQSSYIFRVAPPDLANSKFLVSEMADRRKFTRIAIFADNTGYGEGGLKDLTAELAKRKLEPVYVARFPLGIKSLTEEMRAAKAAGADAIVSYTVGPEQAVAVKSRLEAGMNTPYFAPWPLSFRSVLENAGPGALEGTMMVQTIVHNVLNERRASFFARYYKHSNERRIGSLMAAAQSYDAVNLMLRALFVTKGDTDSAAIKAALENLGRPYQGVVTTYHNPFSNDDHEAFTENMLFLGVWRKGQIEYYYAEDAKRAGYIRRKID